MGEYNKKIIDFKLDLIDNKILFYLSQDLRYSRKKLASELRISPQKLNYRINRLQEELIKPTIILNYPLLGLKSFILLIPHLKEEDIKPISEASETFFLFKIVASNSYILHILSEDVEKFYHDYLKDYQFEVYPITKYIPDNFNPLGIPFNQKEINKSQETYKLDRYDYSVLYQLCKDPSVNNFEISKKAKLDWQTVKKRVNLLLDHDIIKKIRYVVDVYKWGFSYHLIKIRVKPRIKHEILNSIDKNIYSGFRFESFNNIFLLYIPPSIEVLADFIESLKKEDSLLDIEVMPITRNYKTDPIPSSILNYFRERMV